MAGQKCRLSTRLLLLDVLLPIVYKLVAVNNILSLYERGNVLWASCTLFLLFLPGILEIVYWVIEAARGAATWGEAAKWSVTFGPVFPVSIIAW